MPRYPDPTNGRHQQRQRRYRLRLAARRAPEADSVDAALAAAAACYIDAINDGYTARPTEPVPALLMRGTLNLLIADGFDRAEALAVMRRRLLPQERHDLGSLTERSRIRTRMRHA